jgi:hypothetical protein
LNAVRSLAAATCLAAAIAVGTSSAQVTVQEGVSTDTVDLFAKSAKPHKSMALAMCASVLLPGLGHQYLGDNAKALTYYSAEALFIFGALFCNYYGRTIFDNAKAYAFDHAQAAGGAGADDQYWQNVGQYDSRDGYNQQMERIYRSETKDYLTPNLYWQWDDPANETPYNGMLQQSLSWQVASSFFLGAMVLNRLVALIDARFATKQLETKSLSSIQFYPLYNPVARAAGLSLKAGF